MRSSSLWDVTKRRVVVIFIHFGTNYRSNLPLGCPETSVNIYQYTLRNFPEVRRSSALLPSLPWVLLFSIIFIIYHPIKFNKCWEYKIQFSSLFSCFFHYPTASTFSVPDILLSAMLVSQTHAVLSKKDKFHTRTFSGSCFRATGSSPLINLKLANQNVTLNWLFTLQQIKRCHGTSRCISAFTSSRPPHFPVNTKKVIKTNV